MGNSWETLFKINNILPLESPLDSTALDWSFAVHPHTWGHCLAWRGQITVTHRYNDGVAV